MKKNNLTIGFTFNKGNGGPSNFLRNLKNSFERENITKTSYFINPFTSCNIYANVVRNPWKKSYFFRVDGVGFDKSKSQEEMDRLNSEILEGIKGAKGVIYQSEFSKNLAEKTLKYRPKNYTTIINGTNQDIFTSKGSNKRDELGIPEDALVFLSSARWRPRKRLKDTIEIFKIFSKNYKGEVYLLIIGLEDKDEKNIKYIKHIDNSELPSYLRTADIYLFLGWVDPCPNSVVEAISCGLPTICTNIGGTREIVELTNGGIVVETDPKYDFEYVYLDKPPVPKYQLVIDAMNVMSFDLLKYKNKIDKSKVDIKYVAHKYYEFMYQVLKREKVTK